MNARKLIAVSAVVAVFAGLCIGVVLAAMEAPEGVIALTVPEGVKATQPRVDFNHKFHVEFDCTECHHQWDGQSGVQPCNASGCHDEYDNRGAFKSYYRAFHTRVEPGKDYQSCMNCHRTRQGEGKKGGPTTCAKGRSCHVFE